MSNRNGNFRLANNAQGIGDPWEQLQDVLMWTHNRRVVQEFRDVSPEDQEWIVHELRTTRERLRFACTIKDQDSAIMVALRMFLFYVILGHASINQPFYGVPIASYQESRAFKPQIQLSFIEDAQDVEDGYAPVTGEISIRLMSEEPETMTEADVLRYANRVKTLFAASNGFIWRKGKVMVSYTDKKRGYQLQLLCRTKEEGRRVIEQVLDIQTHTPDWKNMNVSQNEEPAERHPTIPPRQFILGRQRRMPRSRPIADCRFVAGYLHMHGLPNPIVLVDRTGYHRRQVAQ